MIQKYMVGILFTAMLGTSGTIHAQSFTQTIGGPSSQDGVGAMPVNDGYIVGIRDHDPEFKTHFGRTYRLSTGGGYLGSADLELDGTVFLQSMANAQSGHAFLFGSMLPVEGNSHQGMVSKLGVTGEVLWTSLDSAAGSHQFLGGAGLPDGGVVVCGMSSENGGHDVLVVRYDAAGVVIWSRTIPSATDEEAHAIAVGGSDLMLTGRSKTFSGASDMLFMRLDLDGNSIWSTSWGGVANEVGRGIVANDDGSFTAAGSTTSYGQMNTVLNAIPAHGYVLCLDLEGDTIWTRLLGDSNAFRHLFAITKGANGDLLLAGETGTIGESDALLYRLSTTGEVIWVRSFDTGKEERVTHLIPDGEGLVGTGWSSGEFGRQLLFIRRNVNGD